MANEMIIIPTKNKEEFFKPKKLLDRLSSEFEDKYYFELETYSGTNSSLINVWGGEQKSEKDTYPLFTMRLYDDLWMIDKTEDIKNLDEMGNTEMANDLLYLLEFKVDDDKAIGIIRTQYSQEISDVCRFLRYYYQCYIFDEGIHPEFIYPLSEVEYNKLKSPIGKKSWISKFKNFFHKP